MTGHTPWSEIRDRSDLTELRDELERLGVSYGRAGACEYVALSDLGDAVWLKGPPRSNLTWRGTAEEALLIAREIPADCGVEAFWQAFLTE